MTVDDVRSADDVSAFVEQLYSVPVQPSAGIVHVTSVWRSEDGSLLSMRINDHTPKSDTDFFVLNLARARADAIVTSGRILREEQTVTHDIQGAPHAVRALESWRKRFCRKSSPPHTVVLTSGKALDFDHPIFHGSTTPVVVTTEEAAGRLASAARSRGVRIVGSAQSGPGTAIAFVQGELGAETVSVELGPSSARELYDPVLIDELLLSTYQGASIPDDVRGAPFIDAATVDRSFGRRSGTELLEASGPWAFSRYVR